MQEIDAVLEKHPFVQRDQLIPVLQDIQELLGYLPEEAILKVAGYFGLPSTKVYSIATFYNQFRFTPRADYHIKICHGTSCHLNGAYSLLKELRNQLEVEEGEVSKDGLFSYEVVTCMGGCGQGPVMAINEEYYTAMNAAKLKEIIKGIRNKEI